MKVSEKIKAGVVTGDDVQVLLDIAKENHFAIPAVNVVGTNSINSVMEAAKTANSPVMIRHSSPGSKEINNPSLTPFITTFSPCMA